SQIHMPPSSALQDDKEYVGFATLPNQVHRKSVKKGFDFTLMVAGESGLGKSTLVNSLFLTDMYRDRKLLNAEERITQTVEITKHVVDIEEKGVKLRLTIVDTPGFGEAVNNTECWKPVADYIDQQFEQYFRDESGLNRKNIQDNRVHCCLYFISPFGHGLRPLDVEFMRALHQRVNIVPILAKADTLTPSEVERKKSKIREEIERYGIRIYQFPECDSDEDEDFKLQDQALKESIPFAVIGSNMVVEAKGRRVRGRLYPWGIVEVENPAHCDFVKLRTMLVKTHMQDLKDVTRETHYENYRAQCIQSMTRMVVKERNRNKLTRESGTDFPIPAIPAVPDSETEKLIREKDKEVSARAGAWVSCQGLHQSHSRMWEAWLELRAALSPTPACSCAGLWSPRSPWQHRQPAAGPDTFPAWRISTSIPLEELTESSSIHSAKLSSALWPPAATTPPWVSLSQNWASGSFPPQELAAPFEGRVCSVHGANWPISLPLLALTHPEADVVSTLPGPVQD
uniref:Septin-type G domain-containing protein n=1 Tax=Gopherus evgoodei TaxID=1825980 RepID=A0A8C4WMZ7_9SAUR